MRYSDVQTQLIDLFLAELEQLNSGNATINFNNTNQLDSLLQFLENSHLPKFSAVPSVNVLHVLLTLACQYPQAIRNHGPANSDDGIEVLSSYMKEIDDKYDNALFKDLLQRRSVRLLNHYVDIALHSKDSSSTQLFKNLEEAFKPICTASLYFGRPRSKQQAPLDDGPSVEVVQDSESDPDDVELIAEAEGDLAAKYRDLKLPVRNVISLSDIGSKTTGLGEATALFQNMPHLLVNGTPEPEEPSSPGGPKSKRQKSEKEALDVLRIFDDHLIANRLKNLKEYNIWELIKWAFACCADSSQFQTYLFNSSETAVHGIWEGYHETILMMFKFFIKQHDRSQNNKLKSFLNNLLTQLGNRYDWYERLVEVVFTGLGQSPHDKPFPCYPQEKVAIKNDCIVHRPLGKDKRIDYDDNIQLLHLRAQIIGAFLYQESDRFQKVELVNELTGKLLDLEPDVVLVFLQQLSSISFVPQNVLQKFVLMVYNKLIGTVVGDKDIGDNFIGYLDLTDERINKLGKLFKARQLYEGITEDSTFKSMKEFQNAWDLVIRICEELVKFTVKSEVSQASLLSEEFYTSIIVILEELKDNAEENYMKFLQSRSWEEMAADDDINFILEPEEIKTLQKQFSNDDNHDRLVNWVLMFGPPTTSK